MRRGLLLVSALLAVAALAGPAGAWYPRTTQVEMATATWCVNCPFADQGIDVNKDRFGRQEFNAIRYYDASGSFGCATSTARLAYYSMAGAGYPTGIFDGAVRVPRGDDLIAGGEPYRDVIESLLDDPTYYKLTVTAVSFAPPTGSISLDLEVMEDVPDIANTFLRILIAEDGLVWNSEIHDDVCRGGVPDVAVTVSQYGDIQHVTRTFAIDPGWTPANLHILAFVQHDADKSIYASVGTLPQESHQFRYYALSPKVAIGDPAPPLAYQFGIFRVINTGTVADQYTANTTFAGPGDWTAMLCDPYGVCYGPTYSTTLYPGDYLDLVVDMGPHSSGFGIATVALTQNGVPGVQRTIENEYISDDYATVLLVDDDGLDSYENYFIDALEHFGHPYAVWKHGAAAPTIDDLMYFPMIVWNLGRSLPTLDAGDRDALGAYLDMGGRVFLSGQDLGKEMHDSPAAYTWFQQQLHARFVTDNSNDRELDGIAGDPISDGLSLVIEGGDGADNQLYPDVIDTNDAFATQLFKYDNSRRGAIRADDGNDKVVVFGFGFEAIDNVADRRVVLHRILRWFEGAVDVPDGAPIYAGALRAFPGVMRTSSTVQFTLPAAGETRLQVFGADGRLVRTLIHDALTAGPHTLSWNGTDGQGRSIPAGIYCYRLQGAGADLQQKVVRIE